MFYSGRIGPSATIFTKSVMLPRYTVTVAVIISPRQPPPAKLVFPHPFYPIFPCPGKEQVMLCGPVRGAFLVSCWPAKPCAKAWVDWSSMATAVIPPCCGRVVARFVGWLLFNSKTHKNTWFGTVWFSHIWYCRYIYLVCLHGPIFDKHASIDYVDGMGREGEAVHPCNLHTKQCFSESPLKAKNL